MKHFLFLILPIMLQVQGLAQDDRVSGMMCILGISDESQLSEESLEQFESLERSPLSINTASIQKLYSSGLFSQYQIASLTDYISQHGDILSIGELSAVDGFGKDYATILSPYLCLDSDKAPGYVGKNYSHAGLTVRETVKAGKASFRLKANYNYGDRLSFSAKTSPYGPGFSLAYSGRKHLERLILGDFNARFGQGLALWSGFSMSGFGAPASLYRRQVGLSPSSSYSDTGLSGFAGSSAWGRFKLSFLLAFPWWRKLLKDGSPQEFSAIGGMNLALFLKNGQISITTVNRVTDSLDLCRVAVDGRFCVKGVDIYGELALDVKGKNCASVLGASFPIGDSRLAFTGRYYPETYAKELTGGVRSGTYTRDENGLTLSYERKKMVLSADWYEKLSTSRQQFKFVATDEVKIHESLLLRPRISYRFRSGGEKAKLELRNDFQKKWQHWNCNLRVDYLRCISSAFLAYTEGGFQNSSLCAYLRMTLFRVDNWDDRIYSYERDAPGNLNIPAYYGRGYSLGLSASWKLYIGIHRIRLYCNGAWITYPWTEIAKAKTGGLESTVKTTGGLKQKKPDVLGLRFQIMYDF